MVARKRFFAPVPGQATAQSGQPGPRSPTNMSTVRLEFGHKEHPLRYGAPAGRRRARKQPRRRRRRPVISFFGPIASIAAAWCSVDRPPPKVLYLPA